MMKSYNIDKSKKFKEACDYGSENINSLTDHHQEGVDLLHGYPWPPRSYTCSFCKREFRSAQALGGHMNVHRRDRARLRQYSPPPKEHGHCTTLPNLNAEPSDDTNPNLVSSSSSTSLTMFPPFTSTLTSSFSPSCFTTPTELKTWGKNNGDVCNINHLELSKKKVTKTLFIDECFGLQKGFSVANEGQIVTLDLEIGLVSDKKEELDLELRLGYT
ncbi:hypothetical protein Leryth_026235 [Lithospermum erythrorhizon]|uniref:C2H2-type domain-containing protein n=1 Tax=Lithospermum erythrorhizon TaxID=34254 RepID=A0AAV3R8R8_LITER|nr:hypothetical protein Leryth_026235 [Lithospermum erythrorhizon]